MTRCASFWRKWEEEGNFCGLDPSEVSRIKAYLEFVGKIEKTGLDREFVFQNFSEGAARPLIAIKDDETRLKGVNYVVACLKRKEKVTAGDLQKTLKAWLKSGDDSCSLNARSEKLTNVKFQDQTAPESEKAVQSEKPPERVKEPEACTSPPAPEDPPKPKPAPCKDFHPESGKPGFVCPDLNCHLTVHKIKGRCCTVIDIPVNQLPGNECPLERKERMKGTTPEPFHRASDGLGNTFVKPPAYKIAKSRLSESERDSMTDTLIEHTSFTPRDIEQIDELVKVNREGWSCRFDLVEAAVMMLLAKAEGA